MTDKQRTTQESGRYSFDTASCAAMMERMIGEQGQGCDCADFFARVKRTQAADADNDCCEVMSRMMAGCCGTVTEAEVAADTDTTGKA